MRSWCAGVEPMRGALARGLLAMTVMFAASRAPAGIADTPLPRFADERPSQLVLAVPAVVKRGRLQTDFFCTALDAEPTHIGVEFFATDGALVNDVHAGVGAVLNVTGGQTVTIGTSGTAAFLESTVVPLAGIAQGSARVVATSTRVRCNAMIVDDALTPPVALATLGAGIRPQLGAVPETAPLPQLAPGRPATHSAAIPGLIKRRRLETDIVCTSLAADAIDIGVQVFAPDGTVLNDVSQGNGAVLDLAPGATVSLGTTGTMALLESAIIETAGVAQGMARVVSTSADLTCTALVLDPDAAPPTSMSGLTP